MRPLIDIVCAVLLAFGLAACDPVSTPKETKTTEAMKAKAAADSIRFTENAEIDNIKKRLELTSNPGLLGFVAVINGVGQIVTYSPVQGKITSGGKRLTAPSKVWGIDRGQYTGSQLGPSPSDEGTWGSSNPYVYWWTPGGQYLQTSMDYVYSDKPFRLSEVPLLLSLDGPDNDGSDQLE